MNTLQKFEERLIRLESGILVVLVLLMLFLASYNVLYRNVLVPIQVKLATSGPPIVEEKSTPKPVKAKPTTPTGNDGAGGFAGPDDEDGAGGFAGPDDEDGAGGFAGPDDEAPDDEEDGAGGFAGPDDEEEAPEEEDGAGGFAGPDDEPDEEDGAGGFAGPDDDEDGAGGFAGPDDEGDDSAGGFAGPDDEETPSKPKKDAKSTKEVAAGKANPPVVQGGPPPEGSFAASVVSLVDGLKLGWVDVFLRQMVIIVGFFGAMLATHRRKHINIDALSKLMSAKAQKIIKVVTNSISTLICGVLTVAGFKLVSLGHEFPVHLFDWADAWVFQLMFPIGFGLMTFHMGMRTAEYIGYLGDDAPLPAEGEIAEAAHAKEANAAAMEALSVKSEAATAKAPEAESEATPESIADEEPSVEPQSDAKASPSENAEEPTAEEKPPAQSKPPVKKGASAGDTKKKSSKRKKKKNRKGR